MSNKPLKIVETVLRDGHQSLAATRMRITDMLPVLEKIDDIGYHAVEAWGGATFDSCLRFLNEDPWERLRTLKKHLPKTPIQMLLRGQNVLGYNHYADDVVTEFVKRSVDNGVSIMRIFDALNDTRNLGCAMKAAKAAVSAAEAMSEDAVAQFYGNVRTQYERTIQLRRTASEYTQMVKRLSSREYLEKALRAGQISIVDYINENKLYYEALEKSLEAERDYRLALAELQSYLD